MSNPAKQIAALDTPQVTQRPHGKTPPVAVPDAVATAKRFVAPNAVPAANPVKIGQAIDIEIAEKLSNMFRADPARMKIYKSKPGKRIVVMEIDVGDGK